MRSTLIATLGSEPQVVTLALDLLRARGESVGSVSVLHTARVNPPTDAALARIEAEFAPENAALRLVELATAAGPLADVDSEAGMRAAFRELYGLVRRAKLAGGKVHLLIAGGRKTMALYGMAAAQLLFDDADRLWYLVSTGRLLAEKRMRLVPGDECRLVAIPVIQWRAVSPVLTALREVENPFEAVERVQRLRLSEQLEDARAFVLGALTGAERRVVELLVREGLPDAGIAERLSVTPRTVGTHLEHVYAKARARWDLETVNRSQLVGLLSYYYTLTENREDSR